MKSRKHEQARRHRNAERVLHWSEEMLASYRRSAAPPKPACRCRPQWARWGGGLRGLLFWRCEHCCRERPWYVWMYRVWFW